MVEFDVFDLGGLDFDAGSVCPSVYTNSKFIKMHFSPKALKITENYEEADIFILEHECPRKDSEWFVISVSEEIQNANVVMSEENALHLITLIDNMSSDEFGVGMADPCDVRNVASGNFIHYDKRFESGRLIYYNRVDLKRNDSLEAIKHLLELKISASSAGLIVFNSQKDSETLKKIIDQLDEFPQEPEYEIIIMQPALVNLNIEHFLELFVFDYIERKADECEQN